MLAYATGKEVASQAETHLRHSLSAPDFSQYSQERIESPIYRHKKITLKPLHSRKKRPCDILQYLKVSSAILTCWGCYYLACKLQALS